jgi:hypothetical protein
MVRRNIKSSGLAIDLKPEIRRKNNVWWYFRYGS